MSSGVLCRSIASLITATVHCIAWNVPSLTNNSGGVSHEEKEEGERPLNLVLSAVAANGITAQVTGTAGGGQSEGAEGADRQAGPGDTRGAPPTSSCP